MIRRYLILLGFSLSALSGCSFIRQTPQSPEMIRAETLLENGKNKEAATLYKQLAAVNSSQQNNYRLLAADALIRANDIKQAKQYIALTDVNALDEAQQGHLSLLLAQIELSHGNAEKALLQLKAIPVEALNNQTKIAYYQSLSFAYSLTGDVVQSTQALINIDPFIHSPKALNKHYEKILSTLSVLSEQALHLKQPLDNTILNGWMSLARVFKLDPVNFADNLLKWRKNYPTHPANSAFLTEYVKNYQQDLARSGVIAVFLPESGAYAAPAAVIKKGFMKAYKLAKKQGETHSEIHFYDTEKDTSANLYSQAIKDGARLVVGPLDKKDIKALVDSTNLTIPVLALNHIEGLNHANLYQFALSPIDDAGQITYKAHVDGHQNALFLVPKSEQGKRFSNYFTDNWQKLGGKTVNVQFYDDSKADFSKLTQQILAQNSSDDQVANDINAIIINAYAKPARLLYPALHKNQATADLPVYATSQIYLGEANQNRDKNLDGVTFCDVPWLLPLAYAGELSQEALYSTWQDLSPSYLRLLPMGIDAYQLISQLNHLKNQPYNGATGKLRLESDNRISRELSCAKFVNGVPKLMDGSNESLSRDTEPKIVAKSANSKQELPELPKLDDVINSLPDAQ